MNYRIFGNTDIKVSEIGLGCSNVGKTFFNMEKDSSLRLLNRAYELGINFFDTADVYRFGNSEKIIGEAFKNKRTEVIIATKVGYNQPPFIARPAKLLMPISIQKQLQKILKYYRKKHKPSFFSRDFSPEFINKAINQSLKRLNTDYIDLYQLHNPPPEVIEHGEVFNTLDNLKKEGKIRFYGVSAGTVSDALLCLKNSNVSSLQIVFNIIMQEAKKELFSLAEQKGVAIIARVPFARGLITSKMNIETSAQPIDKSLLNRYRTKVEEFSFLINKNRSITQAALQFILSHPQVSVVIPGTRKITNLEENIKALESPNLTDEELGKISSVSEEMTAQI